MRVLITGASGLVGTDLSALLTTGGHEVLKLTRTPSEPDEIGWDIQKGEIDASRIEGCDAVVHLAGENIAKGRWTAAKKQRIRDSRVDGTTLIAKTIAGLEKKPSVFYSASAVGYYGDRGNEILKETDPPGTGFLADVCQEWEAAAAPAVEAGIRTVHGRFGVILSPKDGALAKMLPIFKLGMGGKLGNGKMYMPWIALDDVIGSIHFALTQDDLSGPVNVTAPNPVTNAEYTQVLGKVLKRPTILPAPKFGLKLAFGEMAEELLFASMHVVPERLRTAGYKFDFEHLESALRHLLGK